LCEESLLTHGQHPKLASHGKAFQQDACVLAQDPLLGGRADNILLKLCWNYSYSGPKISVQLIGAALPGCPELSFQLSCQWRLARWRQRYSCPTTNTEDK
jgi:hypothetical protein